jgi:hypothetical protein
MRLLLNKLTKLLEMGVAAKELQAAKGFTTSGAGTGTGSTARSATFTTGLSGSFEEVEVRLIATGRGSRSSRSGAGRGCL